MYGAFLSLPAFRQPTDRDAYPSKIKEVYLIKTNNYDGKTHAIQMDSLRVSLVYIPDVSCLSQNDFYVRRISRKAFPNISSGNSHLFLQLWGRERKGSWHTDVFSWCAYRRICCTLHVCNVTGNELAQLAFSGRFNELTRCLR